MRWDESSDSGPSIAGSLRGGRTDVLVQGVEERGPCSNLIVRDCNRLLAALMRGHPCVAGVLYLAIGEGKKSWDAQPPPLSASTRKLTRELLRRFIDPERMVYLDEELKPTPIPTGVLEVHAEFLGREVAVNGFQPVREFGLFGGDATEEADSGFMIDHAVHPRIDLTPGMRLQRRVRLTFETAPQPDRPELPEHWLGDALVSVIDGVGVRFAAALAAAGIESVRGLASVTAVVPIAGISRPRLIGLRARARLALRTAARIAHVEGLGGRTIWELLLTPAEKLASESGASYPAIERLQELAGALEVALGSEILRRTTVGQLTGPAASSQATAIHV